MGSFVTFGSQNRQTHLSKGSKFGNIMGGSRIGTRLSSSADSQVDMANKLEKVKQKLILSH